MVDKITLVTKDENILRDIKKYFKKVNLIEGNIKDRNLNGIVFVNIHDFGILPFSPSTGTYPIAIINKKIAKSNSAALIMKIMSNNYFDFIEYPLKGEDIKNLLEKIQKKEKDEEETYYINNKESDETILCQYLCSIIGSSQYMKNICKVAGEAAPTDLPILITGETGTGKELFAKGIWKLSKRKDKPFIAINCAAIPENLIESELFGYEKGAFTGAEGQKKGKFEIADGGTIFLDEIGEMSLEVQSKLLRVLQEGTFYRVGGEKEIRVNVRVIAATNRDLKQMVAEGKFREDLYYRLNVISIELPPLRDRKEDIPYIVECIINKNNVRINKNIEGFTKEYIEKLKSRQWKGNIRELENVVVRSMVFCRDNVLSLSDLEFLEEEEEKVGIIDENLDKNLEDTIKAYIKKGDIEQLKYKVESIMIKAVLEKTNFNLSKSAEILNINRSTLRKKIKEFKLLSEQL
ncbi:MAG: sigma-54 dependent transcriptional regulator [Hydrogenothermaceae bacterium]|nr:sigma-54 dependent transcriptional regulator [Hydrogenothermaceae bacterium]